MAPWSSAKGRATISPHLNHITNTRQLRIYLTIRYDLLALQLHFVTRLAYNKGQIDQIIADNKDCPAGFGAVMTSRPSPRRSRNIT